MKELAIRQKIAHLESVNDQLLAELEYVDKLMKKVGFASGLESIKATAQRISEIKSEERGS